MRETLDHDTAEPFFQDDEELVFDWTHAQLALLPDSRDSQRPRQAADRWTPFRGPDGAGISDATGLPIEWSESSNVRWKTAIPGKAWSSPVVWGEQVWVTNATEDGKQLSALCIDRQTGKMGRATSSCSPSKSRSSATRSIATPRQRPSSKKGESTCITAATARPASTRPTAARSGSAQNLHATTFAAPARRRSCSANSCS